MAKLIIEAKDEPARMVSLEGDTISIGSAEGNAIRIKSPEISRQHCEIRRKGMVYRLVDLESKTGTKVNGDFVNQHPLDEGDVVELGPLTLRFVREGPQNGVGSGSPRTARRPSRSRMRQRQQSAVVMTVAAVSVGLGLVLVLILALGGDDATHNEQVLARMVQLESEARLNEALVEGRRADRSDSSSTLAEIDALVADLERRIYPQAPPEGTREKQEMLRLLMRLEAPGQDPYEKLAKIDAMLEKYGHRIEGEVNRLRTARARVLEEIEILLGDTPNRFFTARKAADAFIGENRFGEAIAAYKDFYDDNHARMTEEERVKFLPLVRAGVTEAENKASKAWRDEDDRAKNYLARGKRANALQVYRKVVEQFGMEIFQKKAKTAIERITKP